MTAMIDDLHDRSGALQAEGGRAQLGDVDKARPRSRRCRPPEPLAREKAPCCSAGGAKRIL